MHITSHQFLDLTKMFEPITKRTKMVVRPDTIGEIVRLAFKYAESENRALPTLTCRSILLKCRYRNMKNH